MAKLGGETIKLRTVDDLINAHEWLFNKQHSGDIDSKSADALNTTLKGQVKLIVGTRMDLLKIWAQTQVKKLEIPKGMLPPGLSE